MTAVPSDAWFRVFPGPRIPNLLAYVSGTWDWLLRTFASAVTFDHDEPELTDNLCEALSNPDRRFAHGMDCDFQSENWELRRGADGRVVRVARSDIRVILGAPGTPHLILEFKKLSGSTGDRWRYCFDGINRFVEGKYAIGHAVGVMCSFIPNDLTVEPDGIAAYIARDDCARRLSRAPDADGKVVRRPSAIDPVLVRFDTEHQRPTLTPNDPILLLHTLLPCPTDDVIGVEKSTK